LEQMSQGLGWRENDECLAQLHTASDVGSGS
jgi:hypothetical protein